MTTINTNVYKTFSKHDKPRNNHQPEKYSYILVENQRTGKFYSCLVTDNELQQFWKWYNQLKQTRKQPTPNQPTKPFNYPTEV